MKRTYDSSKRKEAALRTRRKILQAALKLHWEGVTEIEPLAQKAGCSVPTVRKHFPTKEALFKGCTRTFAESLTFPDMNALGAIDNPRVRLNACVSELCRIHEAMFGYAWLSAHMRRHSPTLDQEMKGYEGLTDALVGLLVPPESPRGATLRGLLDFLTYRALRLSGGLSPEQARDELIATLDPLLFTDPQPRLESRKERST